MEDIAINKHIIASMKAIIQILFKLFLLIDKLLYYIFKNATKIDNRLIVFEGMMGRFDESSWVLYHYLKEKKKYKFIWIVKNPNYYESSSDTKFVSRYHYTFNIFADYYYAKAAYSFYTHSTSPIKYRRKNQKKIFIGHGYAIKGSKCNGRSINNFDFALTIGKNAIPTQAIFVGCEKHELLPLGLPRNDLLYRNNGSGADNPFFKDVHFKKIIIWMPTFRDSHSKSLSEDLCATDTGLPLFDTEEKVDQLNIFLSRNNCAILLKIHRLQMSKEIFKKKFSNIFIITDNDIDIIGRQLYQIIGYSDALLTDYSSVSIDYLLLDKPIGYILNDIDYYKKDRGFTSENPLDVMAGDFIYSEKDCLKFITNVLNGKDYYQNKRHVLVKKMHDAPNGDCCELISKHFCL